MFFPYSTSTVSKLKLLAVFALVLVIGGECAANRVLLHQRGDAALYADSLEVALSTTQQVLVGVDANRNFWQRRSYQSDMKADNIDKQLKQESKVREQLIFSFDSLSVVLGGSVRDSSGNRVANFHTYKAPYTVDVGVSLPPPPDSGVAQVKVTTDTAHIGVRMACGKAKNGVKPANVTVSTPKWLKVNVDSSEQDEGVCNQKKQNGFLARAKDVLKIGAGVLLGHLIF